MSPSYIESFEKFFQFIPMIESPFLWNCFALLILGSLANKDDISGLSIINKPVHESSTVLPQIEYLVAVPKFAQIPEGLAVLFQFF